MCTVTFVPTEEGFVFSSNRDEDPQRAAQNLVEDERGDLKVYFPQDKGASGTWFAYSNADQFACVLNGAFEPHQRKEFYTMSRGIMALAYFDYTTIDEFINTFNFEGMEPFTLILYNKGDFKELKWDEVELHVRSLSVQDIHLWSSATLYNQEWWLDRSVNFKEFVARKQPDQVGIMDYHKTVLPFVPEALQALLGSSSPLTNLPVKTTSVSTLEKTSLGFKFHFHRTDGQVKLFKSTH
jgi:uncharacterized protein with NRDE domain